MITNVNYFRYVMFLYSNRFYIIFITVWIIGLYFIWAAFHSPPNDTRIKDLEAQIESLQYKLQNIQTDDRGSSQCESFRDEIKRLKQQLRRKKTKSQRKTC